METKGNTVTYSSAHLRERDKILEAKHQKELALVERKADRLRWSYDDTLKQLFDARTRGDKLARSLGFNDIHEAQVAIDTPGNETSLTFKECFARVDLLQADLARERAQHEKLREYLRLVEEERDQQKATAAAALRNSSDLRSAVFKHQEMSDRLSQEMAQLQSRYDAISEVKERAAERYKVDYKKWRKFKNWLFTVEEGLKGKDGRELSTEEKKRWRNRNVLVKRELLIELGPDYAKNYAEGDANSTSSLRPPPMGGTSPLQEKYHPENDKENQATPDSERKQRRLTEPPLSSQRPLSPTIVASTPSSSSSNGTTRLASTPLLKSLTNTMTSSPPISLTHTIKRTTRIPLTFQPISTPKPGSQIKIKQEPSSSPPVPMHRPRPPKRLRTEHAPSSDTEDDSQAIDLFPAPTPVFKVPATVFKSLKSTPKSPIAADSSETEDESQILSQMFPLPSRPNIIRVTQPARTPPLPTFSQSKRDTDRRRSDSGVVSVPNADADIMPPRKIRRLSDDDVQRTPSLQKYSMVTFHKHKLDNDDAGGRPLTPMSSIKGEERRKEDTDANTPATASGSGPTQKRLHDYSAFKGRGRYAKEFASAEKTLNAEYAIDPARNGGMEFQFDEVVRAKGARRHLDAGDCECCRDYYAAIGPLPDRLQAPLWRSPTTKSKGPCSRHGDDSASAYNTRETEMDAEKHAAIASHKQAISRHRHQWERPHTPPGYWNIGFPDTQEAADINERAREMHRRKRQAVESEVRRGTGKYKRRQCA